MNSITSQNLERVEQAAQDTTLRGNLQNLPDTIGIPATIGDSAITSSLTNQGTFGGSTEQSPLQNAAFAPLRKGFSNKEVESIEDTSANSRFRNRVSTLNVKIAAAEIALVAAYAAPIMMGVPFLIEHASVAIQGWCMATFAATWLFRSFASHWVTNQINAQTPDPRYGHQVQEAIAHLPEEARALNPDVKVFSRDAYPYVGLKPNLFTADELRINPEAIAATTTRELTGILAHEYSHANRGTNLLQEFNRVMYSIASPALFWGTAVATSGAIQNTVGSVLAAGIAGITASVVWGSGAVAVSLLEAYLKRNNELKTDLRAVHLTKDPEGLISGLDKLTRTIEARQKILSPQIFRPHPSCDQRAAAIREVFGN